ncbi:hypothetical protein D3C76_786670 [compost metagenome]
MSGKLQEFVKERLQMLIINEDFERREAAKQGVSIRLEPGKVRGIDFIAKELDMSRQALLQRIVEDGMAEVIEAWAATHEDAQQAYRNVQEVMSFREEDL